MELERPKKFRSGYKKKRKKVFHKPKTPAPQAQAASNPDSSASLAATPVAAPSTSTQLPTSIIPSTTLTTSASPSDIPVPVQSRSGKKIALAREAAAASFPPAPSAPEDFSEVYHLFQMKSLIRAVGAFTCCGSPLTVTEDRKARRGFVSKVMIACSVCGKTSAITDPYQEEDQKVNTRAILAARTAGQGRAGLATFTGMMGMLPPLHPSNYSSHNLKLFLASRDAAEANMEAAAAHLRKESSATEDEVIDVTVTLDATWQRRGHQSLYGVVVVASWKTGQVLDIEVLSKYCRECQKKSHLDPTSPEFLDWWEVHQSKCCCNFSGSSGGMEVEGAMRIWNRSVMKHKLRYTSMIADGDSSTYPTIRQAEPYGSAHPIEKHECVGHVQKRMFNHLTALKKQQHRDEKGKIIRLGGKGRLTKALMLKIQRWYGKAIRSNVGDAEAMKNAVMAIYYHSISTDRYPQHDLCPMGLTSWCQHRRAESRGECYPDHNTTICEEIAPIVKKAFIDLSKPSLMERCVFGATQNQNESFNSIIWNRCPKTDFYSSEVVEIAANLAVITFNSGRGALKDVMKRLHIHCGPTTEAFLCSSDDVRVWQAEYKGKELVKKRRRQMRIDRVMTEEEQLRAGGVQYEPGGF